jgi:hypothetical protein
MSRKSKVKGMERFLIQTLMIILSMSLVPVVAYVYDSGSQSLTQKILKMEHSFYDPNCDLNISWALNGSQSHFEAIDDGIRSDSTPNLEDYVFTSRKRSDEVGLPSPSESNIESIILWVYSETGSNAQTSIILRDSGATKATLVVGVGSAKAWRSIVWETHDQIRFLSVQFVHDKVGGGQPTASMVYAAYIEVLYTSQG